MTRPYRLSRDEVLEHARKGAELVRDEGSGKARWYVERHAADRTFTHAVDGRAARWCGGDLRWVAKSRICGARF